MRFSLIALLSIGGYYFCGSLLDELFLFILPRFFFLSAMIVALERLSSKMDLVYMLDGRIIQKRLANTVFIGLGIKQSLKRAS